MLYLTCTMISSVDLAHYGVSRAKDWVNVDYGTRNKKSKKNAMIRKHYKSNVHHQNQKRVRSTHKYLSVCIELFVTMKSSVYCQKEGDWD